MVRKRSWPILRLRPSIALTIGKKYLLLRAVFERLTFQVLVSSFTSRLTYRTVPKFI